MLAAQPRYVRHTEHSICSLVVPGFQAADTVCVRRRCTWECMHAVMSECTAVQGPQQGMQRLAPQQAGNNKFLFGCDNSAGQWVLQSSLDMRHPK